MNARIHAMKAAATRIDRGSQPGAGPDMVNRWLLGAMAEAWRRYPATVELAYGELGEARVLAGELVDRLAAEGLFQLSGDSLALSQAGHAAVDRASRGDARLSDVLRAGVMPAASPASSLVLAVLRAHFELHQGDGHLSVRPSR